MHRIGERPRPVVVAQVEIQYIECSASVPTLFLSFSFSRLHLHTFPLFALVHFYWDECPMVPCVQYLRTGIVQKSRLALLKSRLLSREWAVPQRKLQVNSL